MSTSVRMVSEETIQTLITAREETTLTTILTTIIILIVITTIIITETEAATITGITRTIETLITEITTTIEIRISETIAITRRTATNNALDVEVHTMDLKEDQERHIVQLGARYATTAD